MPAAMEVDERLQSDLRCRVRGGSDRGKLFGESIVGVYIGLVMFAMV